MFTLPTFNLTVNIWRNGNPTSNPPDLVTTANYAQGGRRPGIISELIYAGSTGSLEYVWSQLLLPKLTDIRGRNSVSGPDTVEIPAGSGAFFFVPWVVDSGKGFANEHRVAWVYQNPPFIDPLP